MENPENKGYILVLLAGLLWGTIGIWATLLGNLGMDSMMTAFFRLLSATIILLVILIVKGRGFRLLRISRQGLISCMLVGFVSQAFYNYCYMYAVQNTGMSTAAVLLYTSPVFAAMISRIVLKEQMTRNKILAILINILGCMLTVTGGSLAGAALSTKGILMGVLAGLTYGLMPVLSRLGADQVNPFTSAFYGLAFGALLLLFLAHPYTGVSFHFSLKMFLVLFGYGLIPSALGYIVYFGGLRLIKETSRIPVICSVETVAAALFGFILFHETFGVVKIIGIALVFSSIMVMNGKTEKKADLS